MYMKQLNGEVFETSFPEHHKECIPMTKSEGAKVYREQTIRDLLKMIKPGQTVYTKVESVSNSGMTRRISLYIVQKGQIVNITRRVGIVCQWKQSDKGGLIVTGCGMDMCFHTVYTLGYYLWPKGTKKPHGTRNGQPDMDGGYALKNSSL